MPATGLADWLVRIEALHPAGIDLGLERVVGVYQKLVDRRIAPLVIKVGGTNGKGTCVRFLATLFAGAGKRVATYTSPHLLRFNERVRLDGAPIGDDELINSFEVVEEARGDQALTYFEFTTLAALWWIAQHEPDVAVLEIGLGGRLDAVNVVAAQLSIVTSIGLDHQAWLGSDRESIGFEKGGIFDRQQLAICADPDPPESIAAQARERDARLLQLGRDFFVDPGSDSWRLRLPGKELQGLPRPGGAPLGNFAAALAGLDALDRLPGQAAVASALTDWSIPGRLQRVPWPVEWILDVAHNAEAAEVLARFLLQTPVVGKTCAVIGMLQDKPVEALVAALDGSVSEWFTTRVAGERGLDGHTLANRVAAASRRPVHALDSIGGACSVARSRTRPGDRVLVCGSFRTIGPALGWLGIYSRATGESEFSPATQNGP